MPQDSSESVCAHNAGMTAYTVPAAGVLFIWLSIKKIPKYQKVKYLNIFYTRKNTPS